MLIPLSKNVKNKHFAYSLSNFISTVTGGINKKPYRYGRACMI